MKKILIFASIFCIIILLLISTVLYGYECDNTFLIGGSSVCEYPEDNEHMLPKAGWSMFFKKYAENPTKIINYSSEGQTLNEFLNSLDAKICFNKLNDDVVILQIEESDYSDNDLINNLKEINKKVADKKSKLYIVLPFHTNGDTQLNVYSDNEIKSFAKNEAVTVLDLNLFYKEDYYLLNKDPSHNFVLSFYKDKNKGYDKNGYNIIAADIFAKAIADGVYCNKFYIDSTSHIITKGMFVYYLMSFTETEEYTGKPVFSDVNKDSTYYEAVMQAYSMGIISGDGNGLFKPNDAISLEEACVISVKLMRKLGIDIPYDFRRVSRSMFMQLEEYEHTAYDTMINIGADTMNIKDFAVEYIWDLDTFDQIYMASISFRDQTNFTICDIYRFFYDEIYAL